jgi:hypothetical protein
MSQQKILQINLCNLGHEKILPFCQDNWPHHNWANLKECFKLNDNGKNILTQRIGYNMFPFSTDAIDSCKINPPAYDSAFTKTFDILPIFAVSNDGRYLLEKSLNFSISKLKVII